jgi:hypothetical protein
MLLYGYPPGTTAKRYCKRILPTIKIYPRVTGATNVKANG